ncbi:MAG: PadR family transcriptional regulator [Candidatus Saccharibacteria bacterium]|nr:PadR family transcriptional regulator [Candidatus Saccharibacteria bacterium]
MHAQNCLLGLLSQGPNYGYELKKMYDSLFGREKPILPGQIYSTLARLKRDGKVQELSDADAMEKSAGPGRVKYQITTDGSEYFQKWLAEPEKVNPYLQTTMYFKVVLALLNDTDATVFLDNQRHAHIAQMRDLTKQRIQCNDLATTLLIDNTIYHIEADLRWIELANSRINKLKEELCETGN